MPMMSAALSEASDDFHDHDYDIISTGQRSLESSVAELDLEHLVVGLADGMSAGASAGTVREPAPAKEAKEVFETASLTADEIQAYVKKCLNTPCCPNVVGHGNGNGNGRKWQGEVSVSDRPIRVYVDGIFDHFHTGVALQLRQAKLSFPAVHLIVGPFTDEECRAHNAPTIAPHVERCELVRHCRWVDEVLADAPFVVDETFLRRHRIDYVAIQEGSSIDPSVDKARLTGYDLVKSIGKAIPTRKTQGLTVPPTPSIPYSDIPPIFEEQEEPPYVAESRKELIDFDTPFCEDKAV